jgi:Ca2+-binding RTX toxin-like protein
MSSTITDSHFGLNFVADYERIGSRPWERYDDIVARLNINQTRYPGGTAAETVFDYRNPDATQFTTKSGETLKLTPLSHYIDYCNQFNISPTIIVPTAVLLDEVAMNNHRNFDESQAEALAAFVKNVMSSVDPKLKITFEIGNEYETYMTATEYGRVANRVAQIITEAHNEVPAYAGEEIIIAEPNIVVQAWGYSVGGGMTFEQLLERNLQVISQFTAENLGAVDGVSSHFYYSEGRNGGTDHAQSFELIGNQIERIASLHDAWEDATGRDLISSASEWNVLFRSTTELGLKQLRPLMELFTSFIEYDFDSLDFWSAQYHATSIADASGRLMAAGALFNVLKPAILGTNFLDATHTSTHSSYTFRNDAGSVEVIVSDSAQRTVFDLSAMLDGRALINGYVIGVDERTADGVYRDLSGLLPYAEPDAAVTTSQIPMTVISGAVNSISIDPFETLILIFAEPIPSRVIAFGSDYADLFDSQGVPTMFVGGSSIDTVRYLTASTGVYADLGAAQSVPTDQDTFVSIEMVLGSSHNDTLLGATASDYLFGGWGDDYIAGGEGFDTISGGGGSDTLLGGSDTDEIRGDDGDDLIMPSGGHDRVFGGMGEDTLSVADYARGVSVWVGAGIVESESGQVSFSGMEVFIGTSSDDLFDASVQGCKFFGGDGDDVFRSLAGGSHVAFGEVGNDTFFFYGSGDLSGGVGNDTFFTYGSQNRLFGGEGNDTFYAHGSGDEFVYFGNSGHDRVFGFNGSIDSLMIFTELRGRFTVQLDDVGTSIFFDDGSSVALVGTFNLTGDSIVFI